MPVEGRNYNTLIKVRAPFGPNIKKNSSNGYSKAKKNILKLKIYNDY